MRYISVCSGIEAATAAWHPLGWKPLAFSEIEAFPRAVLAHHYPDVPLHGDFTLLRDQEWIVDADLLVGGTPCQAFSVAGLRRSLSDDRGNLSLEFIRLADAIDDLRCPAERAPCTILWENVPGVLSTKDNAFGHFLAGLAGDDEPYALPAGKRWTDAGVVSGPERTVAWRILDAQYFGVAQRRRRVFVVASAGSIDPVAVLFERESLRRDTPPRRGEGKGVAALTSSGVGTCGSDDNQAQAGRLIPLISPALKARDYKGPSSDGDGDGAPLIPVLTHSLRGEGFDASEDGTGRGTPLVPVAFAHQAAGTQTRLGYDPTSHTTQTLSAKQSIAIAFDTTQITSASNYSNPKPGDPCHPLAAGAHPPAVAFESRYARNGRGAPDDVVPPLKAQSGETGKGDAAPLVAYTIFSPGNVTRGAGAAPNTGGVAPTLKADHGRGASDQFPHIASGMAVRRLTPRECERLQGFPDDYTAVPYRGKPAADGPRYKALGNSMAVPCMAWIGQRIARLGLKPRITLPHLAVFKSVNDANTIPNREESQSGL